MSFENLRTATGTLFIMENSIPGGRRTPQVQGKSLVATPCLLSKIKIRPGNLSFTVPIPRACQLICTFRRKKGHIHAAELTAAFTLLSQISGIGWDGAYVRHFILSLLVILSPIINPRFGKQSEGLK